MKTIILGDIHGNDIWKKIVEEESPDKVIFVGDYFDSSDISFAKQMYNFNEILDYKKSGNAEVTLLIGNHDYHYLPFVYETYSGYQMHNRIIIENAFYENMNHFKICHSIDNILISHAGISSVWLNKCLKATNTESYGSAKSIESLVNLVWEYKPTLFKFEGLDPYGDSEISSPIWIRPKSLQRSNYDNLRKEIIQVVGHTQQRFIDIEGKTTGGRYYYIDTLNTSGEYLGIIDNEIKCFKINN